MIDLFGNTDQQLIDAVQDFSGTGVTNGTGTDLSRFLGRIRLTIAVGNRAGTAPTLDVKFQESDDDDVLDPYLDVPGLFFPQITVAKLDTLPLVIDRRKKFLRPVYTIGGSAGVKWTVILGAIGAVAQVPVS